MSFDLWNYMSLYPPVDDPFPLDGPTPLKVKSSLLETYLPFVSAEKAQSYRNNTNNG